MNTLESALVGKRNIYSDMAEGIGSRLYDMRKENIRESLGGFQSTAHRLEEVTSVRGIRFINDSRATNVNATWFALESMCRPVIWIAGGKNEDMDFSPLIPLVKEKVSTLICLGKDNELLKQVFRPHVSVIIDTHLMEAAVEAAYRTGRPGHVVLLSPACPSFDLFENYADRGEKYKNLVYRL